MPKPRRRGGTPKNQSEEELRAELKRLREIVNSEGSGTFTPGPKLQALLAGILVVLVIVFANQLMPVPKIVPEDIRHPQRSGGKYSTEPMSVNDDIAGSIAFDCSGIPFHNGHISQLKGDGVCDNGWVSVNLSCPRYGFDGGDCGKHEAFSFDEFGPDIDIAAILHDRHYVRNTNTQVWKSKTTPDSPSRDTLPIQPRKGTATVTDEEIEEFQQDGHVLIDGLFSPEELAPFRTALHKSIEAQAEEPPGEMETSNKPFRRAVDAFRRSPGSAHYNLTTSSRLAEAAALLLGTSGVRVFYDELFFKEFGDQPTAWHRDTARYPVLFSAPCISAWVPLVDMDTDHGPIRYLSESNKNNNELFQFIPHDHPQLIRDGDEALQKIEMNQFFDPKSDTIQMVVREGWKSPEVRDEQNRLIMKNYGETHVVDYGSREAGDVSFHSCRTLHAAGANLAEDGKTREALAVVFIGSGMPSSVPKDEYGRKDINYSPAMLPKDELRRVGRENARSFMLPANQMSWVQSAWLHAPFREPKDGQQPSVVHFGKGLAPGATAAEGHPEFRL